MKTIKAKRFRSHHNHFLIIEENLNSRNKIRYKKAKIRKFKYHRYDDLEPFPQHTSGKSQNIKLENINKKFNSGKKEISNGDLKTKQKKKIQNTDKNSDNEEYNFDNYEKLMKALNGSIKSKKKNKIRSISQNYNDKEINRFKEQNKAINTLNPKNFKNKKIEININNNNKQNNNSNYQLTNSNYKLNTNSNYVLNRKLDFGDSKQRINSIKKLPKIPPKTIHNINNDNNNNSSLCLKSTHKRKNKEMIGIDAIKSRFKIKLIEINDKLLDAIHYYNGPIDISCISCNNYVETVRDLNKKVLKNGFKCIKMENNYYKFTNGLNSFSVEIVKIRNNMLYYLVLKDK